MKVIASYTLHYGSPYLAWSARSIAGCVDAAHIIYTPDPSFGQSKTIATPTTESEENLYNEFQRWWPKGKPFRWVKAQFHAEGQHRDYAEKLAREWGADLMLRIDSDEIWDPDSLHHALRHVHADPNRNAITRVDFVHFWRSFDFTCADPMMPERIFDLRHNTISPHRHLYLNVPVLHFGYAQPMELMRYKLDIHGHKNEIPPDWLDRVFKPWVPGNMDVHPTCVGFWNPAPTASRVSQVVDQQLYDHPYFGRGKI